LYGKVPECFSVGPLAGVAAAVLNGGVRGSPTRSVGVVCTDITGIVSGVRIAAVVIRVFWTVDPISCTSDC